MANVILYLDIDGNPRVNVTLEGANTPDDAQAWLDWLNGLSGDDNAANKTEGKTKRKRRTKAEIEADRAASSSPQGESEGADKAADAKPVEEPQQKAEEPAKEAAPEPEPAKEPEVSRKDVEKAMQQLMDLSGADPLLKILSALGAEDEQGRAKLSCLDEAKYAEAIEKLNAAAEDAKAKSSQAEGVLG